MRHIPISLDAPKIFAPEFIAENYIPPECMKYFHYKKLSNLDFHKMTLGYEAELTYEVDGMLYEGESIPFYRAIGLSEEQILVYVIKYGYNLYRWYVKT